MQTFLTLDGVMQAPGGPDEDASDGFTHGGWQAPFDDPAGSEFVSELTGHASAFLLGRRTFDIFRGFWPDQTDPTNPIATAINSLPKYVVSCVWRGRCHVARPAPRHRSARHGRRRASISAAQG